MIGCDFIQRTLDYTRHCGECGEKMPKGTIGLASIKNGVVKKWVCSENCRLDFDNELWQWIATRNAKRRTNSGWLKTKR
jgi:hypothetical protein